MLLCVRTASLQINIREYIDCLDNCTESTTISRFKHLYSLINIFSNGKIGRKVNEKGAFYYISPQSFI